MSAETLPYLTPEEYLALEHAAEMRSEYYASQIDAMGGATPAHITIVENLGAELRAALRGSGCRTYMSDLRVEISAAGLHTYPDVIVGCGKPELEVRHRDCRVPMSEIYYEVEFPSVFGGATGDTDCP